MQDAYDSVWAAQAAPKAGLLGSLRELNHRFLDLPGTGAWDAPARRLAALSAAQRAAAADCPYALFDVRFEDERHWQRRLQESSALRVADEPRADRETVDFVRLALFYVWHVTATAPLRAPLLLGMSEPTAAAFARLTVDRLPELAASEAAHLTPRWPHCGAYWTALLAAASRPEARRLRRVQLSGIQLAAAARLP